MSDERKPSGMKSAYELALERLEREGIERPRAEAFSAETKAAIAEARRGTEAKLAELEILHRDRLAGLADFAQRAEEEREYLAERERIVAAGAARVAKLRQD
jgi:hypothetical protein